MQDVDTDTILIKKDHLADLFMQTDMLKSKLMHAIHFLDKTNCCDSEVAQIAEIIFASYNTTNKNLEILHSILGIDD
jgi:3-isopropylmalate dehydratase small subunit